MKRSLLVLGIVLVLAGAGVLSYERMTYTSEEEVLDVGPLKATAETEKSVPLPQVLGWIVLAGGVVVLIYGASRGRVS